MNEFMGRDEAEIWFQSRMDNKQLQRDLKETEKLSKMTDQQIANERAKIANKTRKAERRWENKSLKGERTNRSAITRYSNQKKAIDQFLFDEKIKDLTTAILTGSLNPKQIKHILDDVNRDVSKNLKKPPLEKLDTSGASILTEAAQTSLGIYSGKAEEERAKYRKIAEEWNALIGENLSKNDALKLKLEEQKEHLEELEEEYKKLRESGGEAFQELLDDIEKTAKGIKKTQEEMKPSFWEKLFNTFKRIGFYRLARDFYRIIINIFKEGVKSLAAFDKNANQTMSSLATSFEKLKGSVALAFMPILETLAPIVQDIVNAVASIANGISRASAAAKGLTKYTRISDKYMKDFSEQTNSALLSFDKFEALKNSSESAYETVDIGDGELSATEQIGESIFNIFNKILDIVGKIWEIVKPIIKAVFQLVEPIIEIVNLLIDVVYPVLQPVVDLIAAIIQHIMGAVKIIAGVLKLLTGDFSGAWETIGEGFKDMALGIVNVFRAIAAYIIKVLKALFVDSNPLFWVLKAFGIDVGARIDNWVDSWSANVSLNTGTSSAVLSTPSGGVSATNSGMSEVMTEAMMTTSQLSSTQQADLNIYLDSQKIGGTKLPNALADEMSRRKLNLNVI